MLNLKYKFFISSLLLLIITSGIFADTTFLREDFNSDWSTTNPPSGWSIFNDSVHSPSWDRRSAGINWRDNTTGYAEISYDGKDKNNHQEIDSLISPIIDCYRYRNIVLRCSTYFRHHNSGNYVAKIIGSDDGGETYPYLVRNYYGEYFNQPKLETLALNWACEKENVRIAFVFSGNINNIEFWCLDNISLTGTYVFDTDASCLKILKPFVVQPPGLCTVHVRVANLGKSDLSSFSVRCSIVDPNATPVHIANGTINSLQVNETTEIALLPAWLIPDPPPFKYHLEAWCEVFDDENKSNDTITLDSIAIQWTENLQFCEDNPNAGENYPIGEQGWGIRFTPNYYPAQIRSVDCYLESDFNCRYKIRVVDDDGIDSAPGTTLYETSIITGNQGWNTAYLFYDDILLISSGSVYIFYIQVDDAPLSPQLFHDGTRTAQAIYYKYVDSAYTRDFPDGDWLLHLFLQYAPFERKEYDLRTVFISKPLNEFVRRPLNYPIKIKARIENFGLADAYSFAVSCTVYTAGFGWVRYADSETIPYLAAGEGTFVEFSPSWNLVYNEPALIIVRTHLLIDQDPTNDRKSKFIQNTVGKFTGGAEDNSYFWYDSDTTNGPIYNWIDTDQAFLVCDDYADDEIFALPPLPFSFPFYDTIFRTVYVSSNGYLTFQNAPSVPTNCSIPAVSEPNCAIYPFWDDLYLPSDGTGRIYRKLIENDSALVVTWLNVARKYALESNRLSFQVILRANGDIIFQYQDVICGAGWADFGKSATVGLEAPDGSNGLQYLFGSETKMTNWPENKLSSGRVIKFYKPTWDIGVRAIINPKDTTIPTSIIPEVRIKNFGTEIADTILLYLHIANSYQPSAMYDTFQFVPRLFPNEERIIQLPAWNAYVGRYSVICSTKYSKDQYFSNNAIQDSVLVSMWVLKPSIPDGPHSKKVKNGALAYSPAFNKIYALKGGNCNEFWCYDIITNTWESLPRMPLAPSNKGPKAGCALVCAGLNIFAFKGGNKSDFYSYDILDKSWLQLPPAQDTVYAGKRYPKDGAGLAYGQDGMVYAILGNNTSVLVRYNPGSQSWSHVAETPGKVKIRDGGSITHHNGILYIFQGGNSRNLWRYNTDIGDWINPTQPCTIPGKKNVVKSGGASTCQSALGIIYFFIGGNKQNLWKYDINGNSFYPLTPIPFGPDPSSGKLNTKVKKGAALVATPIDLIYAVKSGKNNEFWAYAFWGDTMTKFNKNENDQVSLKSDVSLPLSMADGSSLLPLTMFRISYPSMDARQPVIINYSLKDKCLVSVKIYSTTGQLIKTICDHEQSAGNYQASWDGRDLNGQRVKGIYFIRGKVGDKEIFYKLIRI